MKGGIDGAEGDRWNHLTQILSIRFHCFPPSCCPDALPSISDSIRLSHTCPSTWISSLLVHHSNPLTHLVLSSHHLSLFWFHLTPTCLWLCNSSPFTHPIPCAYVFLYLISISPISLIASLASIFPLSPLIWFHL